LALAEDPGYALSDRPRRGRVGESLERMRLGIDLTASRANSDAQDALVAQRHEAAGPGERPSRAKPVAGTLSGLGYRALERGLAAGTSAAHEDNPARKPLG